MIAQLSMSRAVTQPELLSLRHLTTVFLLFSALLTASNVMSSEFERQMDAQSGVEAAITGGFYAIGVGKGLELANVQLESLEGQTMERILNLLQ